MIITSSIKDNPKSPYVVELPEAKALIDTVRCCAIDAGYIEFPNELESLVYFANDLCSNKLLYGSLEYSEFYQNALIVSSLYRELLNRDIDNLFNRIDNVVQFIGITFGKIALEDIDILPASGYIVLVFSKIKEGV